MAEFVLICAAYARVDTTAATVSTGLLDQPPVTHAAQLLPGMRTWWIPESLPGVTFYAVVFAAGVLAAASPRKEACLGLDIANSNHIYF